MNSKYYIFRIDFLASKFAITFTLDIKQEKKYIKNNLLTMTIKNQ